MNMQLDILNWKEVCWNKWKIVKLFQVNILLWSYASHGAQWGVTISHSTCCDCCIRDYHVSVQLFALSGPSLPTLRLKDPRKGWRHNSAGSSDGQVIWVARLSSNPKNTENTLLINNTFLFFLKHACKTINNKQRMFAFLEKRRKNIERGRVTLMSLKSGTLNFCKVWRLFEILQF